MSKKPMRHVRHVRRGTTYEVIGNACLQSAAPVGDCADVMIYRDIKHGRLRARPTPEFEDGRFVEIEIEVQLTSGSHPDAVAKAVEALEAARPFVQYVYDETDRAEAADAKRALEMLDDAVSAISATCSHSISTSPIFDEAAERKAFEEYWEDVRKSFGVADIHYKSMMFTWLASAKSRRA